MKISQKILLSLLFGSCVTAYQTDAARFSEFQDAHQKYNVTPHQKRAGCKNTEECLQLIFTLFTNDDIFQQLEADKKMLTQQQSDLYVSSFFGGVAGQKYADATAYLEKQQAMFDFLQQHKKYIQARQIINAYKKMPHQKSEISRWVKYNNPSHQDSPFVAHHKKGRHDLACIEAFFAQDQKNYPELMQELNQTEQWIKDSLDVTESAYNNERRENEEHEIRELEAQRIREEIDNGRKSLAELEARTRTEQKLADEKEKENSNLSQLYALIYAANRHQFSSQSIDAMHRLRQEIIDRTANITRNNEKKEQVLNETSNLLSKINLEIDHSECLDKLTRTKEKEAKTQHELDVARAAKILVAGMIQEEKRKNNSSTLPTARRSGANDSQLPVATAVPASSNGDDYHGPISTGVPIPENNGTERCPKR